MSSANIMDSGSYFLTRLLVHPCVWGTDMDSRQIIVATPHPHWIICCSRLLQIALLLVWQPQYNVLHQCNILFWYVALPRAYPDLLHRYPIVCVVMKIASVVLLKFLIWIQTIAFIKFSAFLQWAVTNFELLVAFSVVFGNGLRYALTLSIISLQGRCMDILIAMTHVAIDECQLNMDMLGLRTSMVFAGGWLSGSVTRNQRFH